MTRTIYAGRRNAVWAAGTLAVTVLLFTYHTSTEGAGASAGPATSQRPVGGGSAVTAGERSVTGDSVDTEWGPVQVQLVWSGDTIARVEVLRYPAGNGRDVEINNFALPQLVSETLQAQSADIDMVSGATVTSQGYLGSLQSALDQS